MLFQVQCKKDNRILNVYAVKEAKNSQPMFLIFEKNAWKWMKASLYTPAPELKSRERHALKG